ncbi:MAG TPA: FdhF/YdeP family oxidoreductase [Polyangiaceae bacterium]|nr:FdhF/YdeP family oxidoreductase [Polyangiaceae bacterium]
MDDELRDRTLPSGQPPAEQHAPRLGDPSRAAGGAGALAQTIRTAVAQGGVLRGARVLARTNQTDGFDCPGCAWPEPRDRSVVEFCENGAKAVLSETTRRRADSELFARMSVSELAAQSDAWLNDQGRLIHPMILRPGAEHYERIAWDDAFALVACELNALESPDEAAFYTSGRTSNEAAFLFQLFVRAFGTNNLPDCSNMCHESSGAALKEVLGVGKGTVQLEDFELADAIFVVGQNPGTNHPRMLTTLEAAARRGAMIVSVNPLAEVGTMRFAHPQNPLALLGEATTLARIHVPVRINGDVAFFQGVMKAMLEEEARAPGRVLDRAFIEGCTTGYDELAAALRGRTWAELEEASGVDERSMRAAARVAIESRATIVTWAMGLTQHVNAVDNMRAIVDFLLLRGMVGKPGAGACPVRGHSNVQGDRTMGIFHDMPGTWLDRLGAEFRFEPPRTPGLDTVGAIEAMLDGRVKVFFAMGGNFLSAAPDTEKTAAALRRCRCTVHVSTKLHRGHLVAGRHALVLPCLGRTERDIQEGKEQFVTVEDSMGIVHASRGSLPPAGEELLSETRIIARLAQATLTGLERVPAVDWSALADDYDRIRAHIGAVVPGCAGYVERVREPGGFRLRNAARERVFETPNGKALFTVQELPRHALRAGELLMMTIRSHDQYNTTVYGLDDRYRGIRGGRRVVLMNAEDARERRLAGGDRVDITSRFTDGHRVARGFTVVIYAIPRGCCATYFPEANVLVPLGAVARVSNTPASKSVVVSVMPAAESALPGH